MSDADRLGLITTSGFGDYALVDCGHGRKLERFGRVIVDRPEPQALWRPALSGNDWSNAHAVFSASGDDDEKGRWRRDKSIPESWPVRVEDVTVQCRMGGLWHLGLFPEQRPHWQWMIEFLKRVQDEKPRVLNLFGYTGAASLIAARAGAEVAHVDASKKAVSWARENQASSNLTDAKIRWLVDDASKFVAREVRRGRSYHLILIDPPKFGRGPGGEVWDIFRDLPTLLGDCSKLLDARNSAMVLTAYAIRASSLAFDQLMRDVLSESGGHFESGELAIESEQGHLLPTSLFVRWANAQ